MSLSDQEMATLIKNLEWYNKRFFSRDPITSHASLRTYETGLYLYNILIENAISHPHHYIARAKIKHALAHKSVFYNLDDAVEDLNQAIELEPDRGEYYRLRGEYLMPKLSEAAYGSDNFRRPLIERITGDFRASKERNPVDPQLWLDLIEVSILSYDCDAAIGYYGGCMQFMVSKEDHLMRSWLGCLALALAGDPVKDEDLKPLCQTLILIYNEIVEDFAKRNEPRGVYDFLISLIRSRAASYLLDINNFLTTIRKAATSNIQWEKIFGIQRLFVDNFHIWPEYDRIWWDRIWWNERPEKYNKSIELRPVSVRHMDLIDMVLDYDNISSAPYQLEGYYNRVAEWKSDDAETWYIRGITLNTLGRKNEALDAYDKSIKANPNDTTLTAAAWYNQGVILEAFNRHEEALGAYDQALRFPTLDRSLATIVWYNKGNVFRKLGFYERAREAYDRAINLTPIFIDAWMAKAVMLDYGQGSLSIDRGKVLSDENENASVPDDLRDRYEAALEAYDEVIKLRPYYATVLSSHLDEENLRPSALLRKTALSFSLRHSEKAHDAIETAIELFTKNASLWHEKGKMFEKLCRYEEAHNAFNKAKRLEHEYAKMQYELAGDFILQGLKEDTLERLSAAIALDSRYKDMAKKAEPFKSLWDDEDFKRIVE